MFDINSPETFDALLFDGLSSRVRKATIERDYRGNITLNLESGKTHQIAVGEYSTIRPVGNSPIVLRLAVGSEIHVIADERARAAFGLGVSTLTRILEAIENKPVLVLSVVVVAICVSVSAYMYVLPILAKTIAPRIPVAVKQEIGSQGLAFLDRVMFMPSELRGDQEKRASLLVERLQLAVNLPLAPVVITRRMGTRDKEVANAMALLPNTIVITDKLVSSLNDDELEAVLAHEMGHLSLDHGTQSLVRGSAVSIASLALFGGDPGVFQAIAINLVDSKHSRDHEREADRFALEALARRGADPMALHAALRKMSEGRDENELSSYLSTHPMTENRLREIGGFVRQKASLSK